MLPFTSPSPPKTHRRHAIARPQLRSRCLRHLVDHYSLPTTLAEVACKLPRPDSGRQSARQPISCSPSSISCVLSVWSRVIRNLTEKFQLDQTPVLWCARRGGTWVQPQWATDTHDQGQSPLAIRQLPDPAFRRVLLQSLLLAMAVFVGLAVIVWFFMAGTNFFNFWLLEMIVDALGGVAVAVMTWLLFPAVGLVLCQSVSGRCRCRGRKSSLSR